jgi:hypothetical protein
VNALEYAAKPKTIFSADKPNAFKNVTEPSLKKKTFNKQK